MPVSWSRRSRRQGNLVDCSHEAGVRIEEVVGEMLSSDCRLEECLDLAGFPVFTRRIGVETDGRVTFWHTLGRDCWGRLELERSPAVGPVVSLREHPGDADRFRWSRD